MLINNKFLLNKEDHGYNNDTTYFCSSFSTAKFVSENPGLSAFAPSESSGSGTFSMACTKYCDQLIYSRNKDIV